MTGPTLCLPATVSVPFDIVRADGRNAESADQKRYVDVIGTFRGSDRHTVNGICLIGCPVSWCCLVVEFVSMVVRNRPDRPGVELGDIRAVEGYGSCRTGGIWRPCRAESGGEYRDRKSPSEHCRAGKVGYLMGPERDAGDGVTGRAREYDALALRDATGAGDMTIKLIGTPAEESGGDNVQLLERGYSATW